jgi:hypothetical protein
MKMIKTQDAKVQVSIPDVRVTLADLAYLKNLKDNPRVRCNPKRGVEARLVFLGLIEKGQIGPCPKEVDSFNKSLADARVSIKEAVSKENWEKARRAAETLSREYGRPRAHDGFLITKAGLKLLENGTVAARTANIKGCL